MMLKAFPLAHFSMVLLLKGQIIISVNKTLKALVRLTPTKSAVFYRLFHSEGYPEKFP